jgi:S-adenosylmethionine:tRNA-ribosyltransferase-isomerase (queuine synthetase)
MGIFMSEYNKQKNEQASEQELYSLSSYDYVLPEQQIAQQPAQQRDQSRLLVLDCTNKSRQHTRFESLCELFRPDDLLVVNNTKVFPARAKETSVAAQSYFSVRLRAGRCVCARVRLGWERRKGVLGS